jgi:CMP-N,N'-diacetyllegionaminic acid synthase
MLIAIILARGGSKGIPNKNVQELGGYPLVSWSTTYAEVHPIITRAVFSTDSELVIGQDIVLREYLQDFQQLAPGETKEVSKKWFIHRRRSVHALDSATSMDAVVDVLASVKNTWDYGSNKIVLLQPTTPFRSFEELDLILDLSNAIRLPSFSASEVQGPHPYKSFYLRENFEIQLAFDKGSLTGPRQNLPKLFAPDGGFYVADREYILREKRLVDAKSRTFLRRFPLSINIDSIQDLHMSRLVLDPSTADASVTFHHPGDFQIK